MNCENRETRGYGAQESICQKRKHHGKLFDSLEHTSDPVRHFSLFWAHILAVKLMILTRNILQPISVDLVVTGHRNQAGSAFCTVVADRHKKLVHDFRRKIQNHLPTPHILYWGRYRASRVESDPIWSPKVFRRTKNRGRTSFFIFVSLLGISQWFTSVWVGANLQKLVAAENFMHFLGSF